MNAHSETSLAGRSRQTRQVWWPALWFSLSCLLACGQVQAFEARSGTEVTVAAGETVAGDLYLAGNLILINGTITGDVIAAGRTVSVTGSISGDLIVAAQTVTLSGTVGGSVRSAAYSLELTTGAVVAGDLVSAGYSLETAAGSQVGQDLVFGGRQALLRGAVNGDALVGAVGLELSGVIDGSLRATLDSASRSNGLPSSWFDMPRVAAVATGLTLAEGARIGGDLNLTSPAELAVRPGVVQGETTTSVNPKLAVTQPLFLQLLNRFLVLLVVGLLLLWLVPGLLRRATGLLQQQPLRDLGWGALLLIGMPLALLLLLGAVILLTVLFGVIPLTGLAGFVGFAGFLLVLISAALFLLAVIFIAPALAAYAGGRLLLRSTGSRVLALLIGVLLVVLLSAIPVVGGIIALLVIAFGLGVLLFSRRRTERAGVPA